MVTSEVLTMETSMFTRNTHNPTVRKARALFTSTAPTSLKYTGSMCFFASIHSISLHFFHVFKVIFLRAGNISRNADFANVIFRTDLNGLTGVLIEKNPLFWDPLPTYQHRVITAAKSDRLTNFCATQTDSTSWMDMAMLPMSCNLEHS
ncbi:hypothetical protein BTUL_0247g00060 [Botrytis tulipae]|uniref:Uncharacterized protein n=1 Tax=Botrytis tulipae TaxID=87230 RepID=A0A4Z1EB20_9HELO|nr:hypothetical protein BTUL_0247g00060 [Botrytis tulipae]